MDRGRELLDGLLARPDDDAPRLVYADWLLEQGDPRGELIQVQCEIARLERAESEAPEALEARAKTLIAKHKKTWLAPFRSSIKQFKFSRGFPDDLTTTARLFAEGAPTIARHTPIRRLCIDAEPKKADVKRFAETKELGGVRELSVVGHMDAERAAVFFGSPHLAGVEDVTLYGLPALDALAASPSLRKLASLTLVSFVVPEENARILVTGPALARLHTLHFMGRLDDDGSATLIAGLRNLKSARVSFLGSTPVGPKTKRAIAAAGLGPV